MARKGGRYEHKNGELTRTERTQGDVRKTHPASKPAKKQSPKATGGK